MISHWMDRTKKTSILPETSWHLLSIVLLAAQLNTPLKIPIAADLNHLLYQTYSNDFLIYQKYP